MCLRKAGKPGHSHFVYARVLGIYHVNATYTGPGSTHTNSRRFDFLWVRWFDGSKAPASDLSLQRLSLPTVADMSHSIDFLDPTDVLRAAHIIPRFSLGRKHSDDPDAQSSPSTDTECDGSDLSDGAGRNPLAQKRTVTCTHLACQPLRGAVTRCFLSRLADEDNDWTEYLVNRYVARASSPLSTHADSFTSTSVSLILTCS
jgi:hypothetical protein